VLLLGLKAARGERLEVLELGGAIVAVLGGATVAVSAASEAAAAAAADPASASAAPAAELSAVQRFLSASPMVGNLVAFLGSFGAVGYLLCNQELRPLMPAPVQFGLINAVGALYVLPLVALGAEGVKAPLDASREGVFGWLRAEPDRLGVAAYIACVADGMGAMGWVLALKYMSPLTISVVILIMPIAATIEGVAAGLRGLPSLLGALGSLTLLTGTLGVVLASSGSKEETIDATEALTDVKRAGPSAATLDGAESDDSTGSSSPGDDGAGTTGQRAAQLGGGYKGGGRAMQMN